MYFCGRYSISEAVLSIAVADILFSTGSLLVHTAESVFLSSFKSSTTSPISGSDENVIFKYDHVNVSTTPNPFAEWVHPDPPNVTAQFPSEKLILPSEMSEEVKLHARSILCWAYMGLHLVNILMACVLFQAVTQENILKCISYLVITPLLIGLAYASVLYHIFVLGLSPFYYAPTMYPAYWAWKAASLFIVSKYLQQIRDTGRKRKRRDEYYQLGGGGGGDSPTRTTSLINKGTWSDNQQIDDDDEVPLLPRKFDIMEDKLKLDHQTCLGFDDDHAIIRGFLASTSGDGEFGEIAVTLKTLKVTTPTIPHSGRLLKEANLLAFIGEHDSILKFLGVCCKSSLKEKVFLVSEYYPKGRLDAFLKDCVNTYDGKTFTNLLDIGQDRIMVSSTRKQPELPNFDTLNILEWAYQICNGMEFLHQKRIIHGCLQAKSIIIISSNTIKIWDFGFARKLKSSNYTVKREDLPNRFPWRWSALECLTTPASDPIRFSTRSDVWAFSVLIWEIFALGNVPYGAWESDIVRGLLNGVRLEKPKNSSQQLYEIMLACWRPDPLDRPNFALLKLFFQQFLSSLRNSSQLH
ncbi:receptor-like tyrosine-protein kinase kin-16 isoform X1 [Folsomia candida]|uniref:receptor-like tyrosine-protein kinase kin-16 isoform X1 n=1 Tax=Folsomia candida TaxID=158441 RepID=UPI001604B707|nr:receptor-like tyrosine-protein kinase kin-16 isoform X1 [Folsomia candida]